MNNMRRGFTMIELIFVVVIIGILAAVAIPKIAANRDDAAAKVCESEASALLQELVSYYTVNGYMDKIENMSNMETGVSTASGKSGIKNSGSTIPTTSRAIEYVCAGKALVTYKLKNSTYKDVKGKIHQQVGIVVEKGSAGTSIVGKIVVADLENKSFFKPGDGYVIGGN